MWACKCQVFGQNQAEQGHYPFSPSPHGRVYLALQLFLGLLKVSHFDHKFMCIPRESFACDRLNVLCWRTISWGSSWRAVVPSGAVRKVHWNSHVLFLFAPLPILLPKEARVDTWGITSRNVFHFPCCTHWGTQISMNQWIHHSEFSWQQKENIQMLIGFYGHVKSCMPPKKHQFISGSYLFIFCSFFKQEKKIEIQKLLDGEVCVGGHSGWISWTFPPFGIFTCQKEGAL